MSDAERISTLTGLHDTASCSFCAEVQIAKLERSTTSINYFGHANEMLHGVHVQLNKKSEIVISAFGWSGVWGGNGAPWRTLNNSQNNCVAQRKKMSFSMTPATVALGRRWIRDHWFGPWRQAGGTEHQVYSL